MNLLFIDCETSGLPANRYASYLQTNMWPYILQISWQCVNSTDWSCTKSADYFIKPRGPWSQEAEKIHQIPESIVLQFGKDPLVVFNELIEDISNCDIIIAHNLSFDKNCILAEIQRLYTAGLLSKKPITYWPLTKKNLCTMVKTKNYVAIEFPNSKDFKFPKLGELYAKLFGKIYDISGAELHNSKHDVSCLIICFKQLLLLPEFANILTTC